MNRIWRISFSKGNRDVILRATMVLFPFMFLVTGTPPALADDPCRDYAQALQQFAAAARGCAQPCAGVFTVRKINGKSDELINGQRLDFSSSVAAIDLAYSSGGKIVLRQRLNMPGYPDIGSNMDARVVHSNSANGVEVDFYSGNRISCKYLIFANGMQFQVRSFGDPQTAEQVLGAASTREAGAQERSASTTNAAISEIVGFNHRTGSFRKSGVVWTEFDQSARPIFTFKEISRDSSFILLKDEFRGLWLRLPTGGGQSFWASSSGGPWNGLHDLTIVKSLSAQGLGPDDAKVQIRRYMALFGARGSLVFAADGFQSGKEQGLWNDRGEILSPTWLAVFEKVIEARYLGQLQDHKRLVLRKPIEKRMTITRIVHTGLRADVEFRWAYDLPSMAKSYVIREGLCTAIFYNVDGQWRFNTYEGGVLCGADF